MAEPQVMSAQEYGRTVLGYAEGQTIQGKELAKFRDQYARYVQTASKSFTPSIVTVTNPTTQAAEQAFMSSPNSAQLMRDTQPRVQYKPDKEGNLLAIEGTLANYVTNNTGERIKIDPKSNALADALAAMAGPHGSAPQESGGFLSGLFGGGAPVTNAPAPMPTPMATPAATPAATPMPAMAGTNAPVPVAAPMGETFSREQFRQMTGQDLPPGEYADAQGRPFLIR
jgi:hypothetical protein